MTDSIVNFVIIVVLVGVFILGNIVSDLSVKNAINKGTFVIVTNITQEAGSSTTNFDWKVKKH